MKENNTSKNQAIKKVKKNILKNLGKCIKNYRDAMGYSQENLASDISKDNIIPDAVDFSDKMVSRYETGAAEMGIIAFINICRGLKITPNELLKKYFPDLKFERSEFLDRYEQLDDEHRSKVIEYIDYMRFDQDRGEKIDIKIEPLRLSMRRQR